MKHKKANIAIVAIIVAAVISSCVIYARGAYIRELTASLGDELRNYDIIPAKVVSVDDESFVIDKGGFNHDCAVVTKLGLVGLTESQDADKCTVYKVTSKGILINAVVPRVDEGGVVNGGKLMHLSKTTSVGEDDAIETYANSRIMGGILVGYTDSVPCLSSSGMENYCEMRAAVKVEEGMQVYVLVRKKKASTAENENLVRVPNVAGLTIDEAKAKISNAGLDAEVIEIDNPDVPEGVVVKSDPPENTSVKQGSTVKIYCSRGAKKTVEVSNVIGMSLDDAKIELISIGLTVEIKYESSDKEKDTVIMTSPLPGTKVEAGSKVVLTVSSGERG